jgi:RHS repeat-associated protein
VTYGYDDLYRLTSETVASDPHGNNGQVSYAFDNVGNRLQRSSTLPGVVTGLLNYDANDRTSTDPYDAGGNLLSSGAGSNVYDFENRLVQAGGVKIVYDGDGNRASETVAGVTTKYLVADQNLTGYAQVTDELQGTAVTRTYSYGLELINERQTIAGTPTTSFYGFDGHGSVRFLLSSTGAITDTYDYDAFGNLISQTGTTPNNYLFAGEQFDSALGVYYNRARYYDPRQGRFWTVDTWEGDPMSSMSLHKYLYTRGNPINMVDPSGHEDLAEINLTVALYSGLASMALTTAFGAYAAVGTALHLPKDFKTQILKRPSAGIIGVSATVNIGRLLYQLGAAETSVGAGAVVGLQFLSIGGGFEALVPLSGDRIWGYSYWGAFYSVPFGRYNPNGLSADYAGITVLPGVHADFLDASLYIGAVWNVKNPEDYAGPFYCTSGSLLLGIMGIHLSPNATLCSAENGVFSVTTDLTGLGGGPKGSAGSSITRYYFEGEWRRGSH